MGVINEYIRYSQDKLLPIHIFLLNNVLNTGLFPTNLSLGSLIPLYKCNGEKSDPLNYRPITLFKGDYLDFSHLTELKKIYIYEIYMKKQYKSITKNHKIRRKKIMVFP